MTAQAKEYPFRMSCALANGMLDAARFCPVCFHDADFETFWSEIEQFRPRLESTPEQGFGADFVDALQPVDNLSLAWHPPLATAEYTQARFAAPQPFRAKFNHLAASWQP